MKKIIIINGSATSGKNEFIALLKEYCENLKGIDVQIVQTSTVDTPKIAGETFFGCPIEEKSERARRLWCDLKDAWTRFNDGPFQEALEIVRKKFSYFDNRNIDGALFFIHCREPPEIKKFVDYYGNEKCKTLLIRRPDITVPDNHADQNVENYEYDTIIENDGDLKKLQTFAIEYFVEIFDIPIEGKDTMGKLKVKPRKPAEMKTRSTQQLLGTLIQVVREMQLTLQAVVEELNDKNILSSMAVTNRRAEIQEKFNSTPIG